jgi:tetratricopeptide (TPR) repeat protein
MYPYLTPHGLVMKINSETNKLNAAIVKNDMEFWDWYQRRLLHDKAFRRDFPAQKSFSKLRAAIAGLYANNGLISMADQAFREAVLLYPASPEATFRYIQEVLMPLRKWDAIKDMLDYTDRVDPNNKRTGHMGAYLQKLVAVSAQIDKYTAKAARGQLSATESIRLAQCYQTIGQTARALETVRKTILMPDAQRNFDVLFLAAHIFSTSGMRGDAATTMKRALAAMPDNLDPVYRRTIAKIFMEGGLNAEAESALNALLQIQPHDADALLDRAIARDSLGQTQAAMGDLVTASQINRDIFARRLSSSEKLQLLTEKLRRIMPSSQPRRTQPSSILPLGY